MLRRYNNNKMSSGQFDYGGQQTANSVGYLLTEYKFVRKHTCALYLLLNSEEWDSTELNILL